MNTSSPRAASVSLSHVALLPDRGVVRVGGADAGKFLQGLVTHDIGRLAKQPAIHAGLLTPQGKIQFEFFVVQDDGGFWIDIAREKAAEFVKRLTFYKLRAAVTLTDSSAELDVCAAWGDGARTMPTAVLKAYGDPRLADLGERWLLPSGAAEGFCAMTGGPVRAAADAYHAHRIALGIPEGGKDYAFGDTFPHEANFDVLGGVDFDKGCFVGQEVVSRMQHRAIVRKRIVPVIGSSALPLSGTKIESDGVVIGTLGSTAGTRGLALLRLDRAEEAVAGGKTLTTGGVSITIERPSWASFAMPRRAGS